MRIILNFYIHLYIYPNGLAHWNKRQVFRVQSSFVSYKCALRKPTCSVVIDCGHRCLLFVNFSDCLGLFIKHTFEELVK